MAHYNPRYTVDDLYNINGLCGVPEDMLKTIIAMARLQDHNHGCEHTGQEVSQRSASIWETTQAMLNAYRVDRNGNATLYFAEVDYSTSKQSPLYSREVLKVMSDAKAYFKDTMCSGKSNLRGWFYLLKPTKSGGKEDTILPTGDIQWLQNTFKMLDASQLEIYCSQSKSWQRNGDKPVAFDPTNDQPPYMNLSRAEISKRLNAVIKRREYRKLQQEKITNFRYKLAK